MRPQSLDKKQRKRNKILSVQTPLSEFASAKLNLYLHVGLARPDGLHPIESLAVFVDLGDRVSLHPETETSLEILPSALSAPLLCESAQNNLVMKAAQGFRDVFSGGRLGKFTLEKELPTASGLGGGSADAAATLRLLARESGIALNDSRLLSLAARLGSDVPGCLFSRPCFLQGVGNEVCALFSLPRLFVLLVNPGVLVPTARVFKKFDESCEAQAIVFSEKEALKGSVAAVCAALKKTRNDLEKPAIMIAPVIQTVLEALCAQEGSLLSRMSGSGATCFAVFRKESEARNAMASLRARYPQWWVRAGATTT